MLSVNVHRHFASGQLMPSPLAKLVLFATHCPRLPNLVAGTAINKVAIFFLRLTILSRGPCHPHWHFHCLPLSTPHSFHNFHTATSVVRQSMVASKFRVLPKALAMWADTNLPWSQCELLLLESNALDHRRALPKQIREGLPSLKKRHAFPMAAECHQHSAHLISAQVLPKEGHDAQQLGSVTQRFFGSLKPFHQFQLGLSHDPRIYSLLRLQGKGMNTIFEDARKDCQETYLGYACSLQN